jgi:hypothetical protein
MASPQRENGHVEIANELFDALCRFRIPGEARQCLDAISTVSIPDPGRSKTVP